MNYFIIAYFIWNVIAFCMMGIDKYQAQHDKWRISEKTLLIIAFAMGGVGAFAGSKYFRHKTQKLKFKVFLPVASILNIIIAYTIILMFLGIIGK